MSRLRQLLRRLAPRRLHEDEGGQAMVEFVLVFPIQLVLSLCVLQFAFVAHAHLVVEQAAFMGARAAAVADTYVPGGRDFDDEAGWKAAGTKVARRVAARTCSVLTSAQPPASPAQIDEQDDRKAMRWFAEGKGYILADARVQEAFKHLEVEVTPRAADGYVACTVTFDYVMFIPVANHIFAQAQMKLGLGTVAEGDPYNDASRLRQRTCFRVTQASFISTPWTRGPR